ncbi:O-acyltransferase like protein-like [Zerene cesonia]|uniref:O-acyltransferase like protein-like n=1 Tax=Zerene cesonia TaxID=33412 RepID=UPI0018E5A467|nr:O-acyltransferase like protein-like [Zerene cesonia]
MLLILWFTVLLLSSRDVFCYRLNETEYARMPPLFHLDQYDRCLSQEDGLYCIMSISLRANQKNELMQMIEKYSADEIIHYNHTYLDHGICVTHRCKSFISNINKGNTKDLQSALERCINEYYEKRYGLSTSISIHYCKKPNEGLDIDIGDWIFGGSLLMLVTINLVATVYDLRLNRKLDKDGRNRTGNQLLLCFSIVRNWKQLICPETRDERFEIFKGINGLRSILTFLMIFAHTMWLMACGYIDNPLDFEKTYDNILYHFIYNGMMLVQTYFLMSGCLLVFSLMLNPETISWGQLPLILFYRWCRLTGSLAVTLGFITTWYRHFGYGPLWDYHVTPIIENCRQYWWSHILFINNYVEGNKGCAIQTWHLAVELQLFVIGLVVLMLTRARGRKLAIFVMFLVGCVGPALHVWIQDYDGVIIMQPEFYRKFQSDMFSNVHIKFHNNIACYAIGMILGLFIYNAQKRRTFEISKNEKLGYITWAVIPLIILWYFSGTVFYKEGEKASMTSRLVYAASHRALLGAGLSYLILSLVFKFEDIVRGFLEWSGWRVPSKLSYAVFLIHVSVVHYLQGTRHQLGHAAFFHVIISHLGVVWASYILALPMHILVEVPITACFKFLLYERNVNAVKKIE